jgi:hypothetical protein
MSETVYFPSSDGSSFYSVHSALMQPSQAQPEDSSYAIQKGLAGNTGRPISYSLLRDLCAHLSVGRKVFVIIEHESVFEIKRLKDGDSAKLFYKFLLPNEVKQIDSSDRAMESLKALLKDYQTTPIEKILKYDTNITIEMQNEEVISYSYIQRRLASVSAFRNSMEGSSAKLKDCLKCLIERGNIIEVPDNIKKKTFNLNAILYKVMKHED